MNPQVLMVVTLVSAGVQLLGLVIVLIKVSYLAGTQTEKINGLEKRVDRVEKVVFPNWRVEI